METWKSVYIMSAESTCYGLGEVANIGSSRKEEVAEVALPSQTPNNSNQKNDQFKHVYFWC